MTTPELIVHIAKDGVVHELLQLGVPDSGERLMHNGKRAMAIAACTPVTCLMCLADSLEG